MTATSLERTIEAIRRPVRRQAPRERDAVRVAVAVPCKAVTPFQFSNTVTTGLLGCVRVCPTTWRTSHAVIAARGTNALALAHARHSLLTLASSLGEHTCVRPLRWSVDVLAQMLGVPSGFGHRPYVGSVSSVWLRQYETDSEKHNAGQ